MAALRHGLTQVDSVVSFTAVGNARSRQVMERIGLRQDADVDHPRLVAGHPLRRHVLYRADRDTWPPAGLDLPPPPDPREPGRS